MDPPDVCKSDANYGDCFAASCANGWEGAIFYQAWLHDIAACPASPADVAARTCIDDPPVPGKCVNGSSYNCPDYYASCSGIRAPAIYPAPTPAPMAGGGQSATILVLAVLLAVSVLVAVGALYRASQLQEELAQRLDAGSYLEMSSQAAPA